MKDFFTWFRETPEAAAPWCILGKGPSFARRDAHDLSGTNLLSLNHVVRELRVRVAHFIDLDACLACTDAVQGNADVCVMPWMPHVGSKAGRENLQQLAAREPALAELDRAGRLLAYNLATAPAASRLAGSPVVPGEFFSAEAALALLALAGARVVRSLGVDGGTGYAVVFRDLADSTLLANRRHSFDRQFESIAKVIRMTGVDYAPLDVESPVRVYVATTEAQMLAVKVLEFSIRKHASLTVQVFPLHEAGIDVPLPAAKANQPRTPFSFQRFLIPQLAGYRGRAIYLDSDMQVFRDIRELGPLPLDGADLLAAREPDGSARRPQFSVMLLDCAALTWDIRDIVRRLDAGELTYEGLMGEMRVAREVRAAIAPAWNSLERYHNGVTGLVHYTDMPTQPWVSAANPLGYLWMRDLIEAVDDGVIPMDYVREHILRGWVRPSVEWQILHRHEDAVILPRAARALDRDFRPPWVTYAPPASPLVGGARRVVATLRQAWLRSPLPVVKRRITERLFPK